MWTNWVCEVKGMNMKPKGFTKVASSMWTSSCWNSRSRNSQMCTVNGEIWDWKNLQISLVWDSNSHKFLTVWPPNAIRLGLMAAHLYMNEIYCFLWLAWMWGDSWIIWPPFASLFTSSCFAYLHWQVKEIIVINFLLMDKKGNLSRTVLGHFGGFLFCHSWFFNKNYWQ